MANVLHFRPYPFEAGRKIYIEGGPRKGDWEVTGFDGKKVKLKCPLSGREAEWAQFCYFVEEKDEDWPHRDEEN